MAQVEELRLLDDGGAVGKVEGQVFPGNNGVALGDAHQAFGGDQPLARVVSQQLPLNGEIAVGDDGVLIAQSVGCGIQSVAGGSDLHPIGELGTDGHTKEGQPHEHHQRLPEQLHKPVSSEVGRQARRHRGGSVQKVSC